MSLTYGLAGRSYDLAKNDRMYCLRTFGSSPFWLLWINTLKYVHKFSKYDGLSNNNRKTAYIDLKSNTKKGVLEKHVVQNIHKF